MNNEQRGLGARVALTGGIACGKSLVAAFLNELGVETLDADDVVHELLPDPAERKRMAAEVFADPAKRRALESRLHPLVKERINAFLNSNVSNLSNLSNVSNVSNLSNLSNVSNVSPIRLAIIPLLFETHWDAEYDIILCVTSKREEQIARMMTTRGYSRAEAEARLAAQLPVAEKAAKSHYVVENDGSPDELRAKVAAMVEWLKKETEHGRGT